MNPEILSILIKYTAQTISKANKEYYKRLLYNFYELPIKELFNQICKYTELTMKQIKDNTYITMNIVPKLKD